jgi:hypothetical protein
MRKRSLQDAVFALGLGALVLTAAACAGGAASPRVAHLGAGTTTTVPLSPGPSVTSVRALQSDELAFARCMRSHGEPSYPDPGSQGAFSATKSPADLDFSSPLFQAAQRACQKFLPSAGVASPAQQEAVTAKAVEFARCMRSHGLTTVPDPGAGPGGHRGYFVEALSGPLSPSNPQFARAQKTCQKLAGGNY